MNPVNNHKTINHPADPTMRDMSALTIKIPEPIIEPATIAVASNNPKDLLKSVVSSVIFYK